MKIVFTNHAKYRIMKRGISAVLVKNVIKNPDSQSLSENGMMVVRKSIERKVIEVVYKVDRSNYVIITAYYGN